MTTSVPPQTGDSTALAAAKLYSQAGLIINNGVATMPGGGSSVGGA